MEPDARGLEDIERIEVLRGTTGRLGLNAQPRVVNIITLDPSQAKAPPSPPAMATRARRHGTFRRQRGPGNFVSPRSNGTTRALPTATTGSTIPAPAWSTSGVS